MRSYIAFASFLLSSDKRHDLAPPRDALPRKTKRSSGMSGSRPIVLAFPTFMKLPNPPAMKSLSMSLNVLSTDPQEDLAASIDGRFGPDYIGYVIVGDDDPARSTSRRATVLLRFLNDELHSPVRATDTL